MARADRGRLCRRLVPAAVGTALLFASVVAEAKEGPAGDSSSPPEVARQLQRPSSLIGAWRVTAPGEQPGLLVSWGPYEIAIFRKCGQMWGRAEALPSGMFLGDLMGGPMRCFYGPDGTDLSPEVAWLRDARAFQADGDVRQLLGEGGQVVATLRPAVLSKRKRAALREAETPTVDQVTAEKLDAVRVDLPQGLVPADADTVAGRWIPQDAAESYSETEPHLDFLAGRRWKGSDGCNTVGGKVSVRDGFVLTLGAGGTSMSCPGLRRIERPLLQAVRAGLHDDVLVLIGPDGAELERLVRDRSRITDRRRRNADLPTSSHG